MTFHRYFVNAKKIQLVKDLSREKTSPEGIEVRSLSQWLSKLKLN